VLTRDKLQQVLYGWARKPKATPSKCNIHHLRKKFFPELIRTVRGVGYLVDKPDALDPHAHAGPRARAARGLAGRDLVEELQGRRTQIEELFDAQLAQTARLLDGMVARDMPRSARESLQRALDLASGAAMPRGRGIATKASSRSRCGRRRRRRPALGERASGPRRRTAVGAGPAAPAARAPAPASAHAPVRPLVGYHNVTVGEHRWRVFVLQDVRDAQWIVVGEREDVRGELGEDRMRSCCRTSSACLCSRCSSGSRSAGACGR